MDNGQENGGLKQIWVVNKKPISLILFIISSVVAILCCWGIFFGDTAGKDLTSIFDTLGGWIFWLLLGSIVISFFFGWIFFDYNKKSQTFEKLMKTDSKKEFIRNRDELEYTAAQLGPKFEDQVYEKTLELKIK